MLTGDLSAVVNTFNFMYVPPTGRVLYVNIMGLVWNSYMRRVCFSSKAGRVIGGG